MRGVAGARLPLRFFLPKTCVSLGLRYYGQRTQTILQKSEKGCRWGKGCLFSKLRGLLILSKKMHHNSHHYTFTFSLWLRYDFEWDKFGSNCCKQCCSNVFVNNNQPNDNNQKIRFSEKNNKEKILKRNNSTTKCRVFLTVSPDFQYQNEANLKFSM